MPPVTGATKPAVPSRRGAARKRGSMRPATKGGTVISVPSLTEPGATTISVPVAATGPTRTIEPTVALGGTTISVPSLTEPGATTISVPVSLGTGTIGHDVSAAFGPKK